MVSGATMKAATQKKAASSTAKREGKAVVTATVDDVAKRAAKKKTDDMAKKAAQKKADGAAKKAAQKKADGVAKKAAQKKADGVAEKAAEKRVTKAAVAAFKAAATADYVANKVAAASFKAAANAFGVANAGRTLQMSDQTCTGVHCSHTPSRDMRPAKENMREKEENTARPGLVQWNQHKGIVYRAIMEQCRGVVASAIFGAYDLIQPPTNISEAAKKNVCVFMFVDEETELFLRNSSQLDSNKKHGLWRTVVVHNLPYADPRRNGKISSVGGKYNHGRGKIPVAPKVESTNFLGLPIRPGAKDCSYYMVNGSCKFESNCRFNHPDPTTVEGGDAPSVCGNGGSGPSQGAFQPTMFSWSPPRTADDNVPPSNVEWNGYQNTTIMENFELHSLLTTAAAAPSPLASPTTTASPPPALPTVIDSALPVSPTAADGTPLTSPILVEDGPYLGKAARYRILHSKMEKLCARACESKAAHEFVNTRVDYLCTEVDKMFLEVGESIDGGSERFDVVDAKFPKVNGLKKGVHLHRVRRRVKKKVISKPTLLGQQTGA